MLRCCAVLLVVVGCTFDPTSPASVTGGGAGGGGSGAGSNEGSSAGSATGSSGSGSAGDGSGSGSSAPLPAGQLALWQVDAYDWQFGVADSTGTELLASNYYSDRQGAIGGVLWVFDHGCDVSRYVVIDDDGDAGASLDLVATNHDVMASSDSYASDGDASAAIATTTNAVETYLAARAAATGARFEVAEDTGMFLVVVHGADGGVLMQSTPYSSETSAYNGAFAIQGAGSTAARYGVAAQGSGYVVTLTASNGQPLATTGSYASVDDAQAAIAAAVATVSTLSVL
jgi:uncharacterized protein YegP (UPF0339 family)|nr:hypothetical protein [Kofleriaceae bacterium]